MKPRLIWALWAAMAAMFLVLLEYPRVTTISKALHLLSLMLVIAMPMVVAWRRKAVRYGAIAIGAILVGLVLLPSHGQSGLRSAYVATLERYVGVTYMWGGETERDIDCSGLLRRAYLRSMLGRGIVTLDGGLIRRGLCVWWFDCSARDLMDGYRGLTHPIAAKSTLPKADYATLRPGDLAITADGIHCLAYMGGRKWIDADPDVHRVAILDVDADSSQWLRIPCVFVRWDWASDVDG